MNLVAKIASVLARWPRRAALVIAALSLSSLTEALGLASLLPLLTILFDSESENPSPLTLAVRDGFETVGIPLTVPSIVGFIAAALTLKIALSTAARLFMLLTSIGVETNARRRLLAGLVRARQSFHIDLRSGSFVNAMNNEIQVYSRVFREACWLVTHTINVGVYIAFAVWASWHITIGAVAAGIVIISVLGLILRVTKRSAEIFARNMSDLTGEISDGLLNIKALKAMAGDAFFEKRIAGHIGRVAGAMRSVMTARVLLDEGRQCLVILVILPGLIAALYLLNEAVETVIVLALLFSRTMLALGLVQSAYQSFLESWPFSMRAIERIESAEAAAEATGGAPYDGFSRSIELRDVDFSYGSKQVLNSVSLKIEKGTITALVGASGGGKTTIADIILGFLQPDRGSVLVDGDPLSQFDLSAWRRSLGYVPQELLLFHDTIRQNISLGDPDISTADIEQALSAAGARSFIERLPNGIDTVVGERGAKFSGGQRQRISLARALVRRPDLLILDEPTTALDPTTEAEICDTLRNLAGDVTLLVISHQPAIVGIAEAVYEVEAGRVSSRGEIGRATEIETGATSANLVGERTHAGFR